VLGVARTPSRGVAGAEVAGAMDRGGANAVAFGAVERGAVDRGAVDRGAVDSRAADSGVGGRIGVDSVRGVRGSVDSGAVDGGGVDDGVDGSAGGRVGGRVGVGGGVVAGDVTDAARVAELVVGRDAVIAGVYDGGSDPGEFFPRAARALVEGMGKAGVRRLVWVGLASILPAADGTLLMDSEGYPNEYRSFFLAHQAALDIFAESSLDWVSIAPSGDFDHADPSRTGRYRVAPADARALISYADLAIALVDEVDNPAHHGEAIGVAG
jgi:hypothetical protein